MDAEDRFSPGRLLLAPPLIRGEAAFWKNFSRIIDFLNEHGSLSPLAGRDVRLYNWLIFLFMSARRGRLEPDRLKVAELLFPIFKKSVPAEFLSLAQMSPHMLAWLARLEDVATTLRQRKPLGKARSKWIGQQRFARQKGRLSDVQVRLFEEAGLSWDAGKGRALSRRQATADDLWRAQVDDYLACRNTGVLPEEVRVWIGRMRSLKRDGVLPPQRLQDLRAIKFNFEAESP